MRMALEIGPVEERLKSFAAQLQTECGILERLVYKHKNQHRRCSYFQYVLKVRRDLKLLKSANLEEVLDSSFIVFNGNRPKQKVQLLESLKRRKCSSGKNNFLERLLGVGRLLSQIVEPLLKAAMEISTLLARSFFMKFSLTILAVLARIRVLAQQMLLDVVHLYNTVSSLSHREQVVKLNQEGFEVFREYYPGKEKDATRLECIWQVDKYVLVEKTCGSESNFQEKDEQVDVLLNASNIQYDNVEVLLRVDESGIEGAKPGSADQVNNEKTGTDSVHTNGGKDIGNTADGTRASNTNIVPLQDGDTNSSAGSSIFETKSKKLHEDGLSIARTPSISGTSCEPDLPSSSSVSTPSRHLKRKNETRKEVAFVSVKPPTPSTAKESGLQSKGVDKSPGDKEDPFFSLLTGGSS